METTRSTLVKALKLSDDQTRERRADRIEWMASCNHRPTAIMGRPETLALLSEAESAFREGHFISVQLLALALIEHTIVEELIDRCHTSSKDRIELCAAIKKAREFSILDNAVLDRIDALRLLRNPFAHLRAHDDPLTFGNRYRAKDVHPQAMLETDAKEAFEVMYIVFRTLLKEAPFLQMEA